MKLHLHFLDMAREGSNPDTKLMLAMTQFWLKQGSNPVVMTFGTAAMKIDGPLHSTKANTLAFTQLFLRQEPIEGDLAASLYDVARKSHQEGAPTWLHYMFGLNSGAPFPTELMGYSASSCQIGPELAKATIEVFVHHTIPEVKGAYRPPGSKPNRGAGARSRTAPLQSLGSEERDRLADRLLGAVQITKLTIEVQKNKCGTWTEAGADSRVLPLTSKDIFQLVVECSHKAHIYVAWVGSSGNEVTPIFPWLPINGWEDLKAGGRDHPRKRLVLPENYISELPKNLMHLQSIGQAGAETLVVIAHVTELKRTQLQGYFNQAVEGQSRRPIGYHFKDRLETMNIERRTCEVAGMGLTSGPSSDALARLKERLEHLPMVVDACKALVIPTLGGK